MSGLSLTSSHKIKQSSKKVINQETSTNYTKINKMTSLSESVKVAVEKTKLQTKELMQMVEASAEVSPTSANCICLYHAVPQ